MPEIFPHVPSMMFSQRPVKKFVDHTVSDIFS